MSMQPASVAPPGRVLATLNEDGSRRWIRPKPSVGPWWARRRAVAYTLMFVFFIVPYLRFAGRPLVLLDLPRREFTLIGTTFLPTDTLLFMLLFLSAGIGIFLLTALFGRVWCGWGCPQTVYMEFLFRPIERLLEGGSLGSQKLDRSGVLQPIRLLKYAIFLLLAMFLAHTFLAYFVGIAALARWVTGSPAQHPTAFLVMAGTTLAIFLDFTWFREQTCLVACPYGRLQSVLLDRRSLIVGYDTRRGEPRRFGSKDRPQGLGDCIDCNMCVTTCPTGIDIRDGLQMECIHCTQCVDACDAVMVKIGKPKGLIRYSTRDELSGLPRKLLRTRVVLYPLALAVALSLFGWNLVTRAHSEVTLLRGQGAPYVLEDGGRVVDQVRLKIANRDRGPHQYEIHLAGDADATLIAPIDPFPVAGDHTGTTTVFITSPASAYRDGARTIHFSIDDGGSFRRSYAYPLLGPTTGEALGRTP